MYKYLVLLLLSSGLFCACINKRDEFRPNGAINYTIENAIEANLGTYLTAGKINDMPMDAIDIQISKASPNTIQVHSNVFPLITTTVNSLTLYQDYAQPGGSGLDLISSSNGIQFSIISGNLTLKYQNNTVKIDLLGKKN